ncbi:hypothetical protein FSPOR_6687 [Fusarium sporotrichioides]|uniref:Uncharacterized protein n=1 Tax=Fusarium sporotrichioides TaxID=5514 RepID=A0A395S2N3_FUSSP|nr:hypothetical protein FSPOR_6687 [Fusarium sporotrichioides]
MLFTPLLLVFPAVSLASWLPIVPRQASNGDNCTFTSMLPTITLSSIYPTSTVGSHGQVTGGGSLIYTTAFPTLGPDGPGLHTYTITAPCAETQCQRPPSADCPPGFTKTTVVCHACGEHAITTILTLPVESAAAGQGSAGGDSRKEASTDLGSAGNQDVIGSAVTLTAFVTTTSRRTLVPGSVKPTESPSSPESSFPWKSPQGPALPNNPEHSHVPGDSSHLDTKHTRPTGSRESDYPAINRYPGSLDSPVAPASSAGTVPQSETVDGPDSVPTGAGAGAEAGSESPSSTYPSGQATPVNPTAIVVTGNAPGGNIARDTLVKVAAFAIILLYPLYV